MSRVIQVGDLVQVVRWTCCGAHLGKVGMVLKFIGTTSIGGGCWQCSKKKGPTMVPAVALTCTKVAPLEWLKRIPPLEELEGERTEEKPREPA